MHTASIHKLDILAACLCPALQEEERGDIDRRMGTLAAQRAEADEALVQLHGLQEAHERAVVAAAAREQAVDARLASAMQMDGG